MNVKSIILQKLLVTFLIFGMVSQVVANKGEERTTFISKQAQEEFVTGTITDAATSETLLGVNVIIKKKDIGTSSDFDGQYKIQAKPGDVLEFSYLGYITKQVVVTKSNEVINIQLEESKGTLDEIIVVGYKKKQIKDVTEAVVNVNQVKELDTRPVFNAEEILQGNTPGVTFLNDGGDPTKSPIVKIRGISSLNEEKPLIVVDGVPELPMPSPSNIASITVLKDATAAIYGARSSGGVILVTTKKGSNRKTSINFNTYVGFQSVANLLKPLNTKEYIEARKQTLTNDNVPLSNEKWLNLLALEKTNLPDNNWLEAIFRDALVQNYDLSFSGGGDKSRFFTNLGYRKTEGILLNNYAERISLRLNSDYKLGKNVKVGENIEISYTNGNYDINTVDQQNGVVFGALTTRSLHPFRDKDGNLSGGDANLRNPLKYLLQKDDKRPTTNISGNIFLDYTFLSDFTFKILFGINKKEGTHRRYRAADSKDNSNALYRKSVNEFSWLSQTTLSYNRNLGNHKFDVLGGISFERNRGSEFSVEAKNYPNLAEELRYLSVQVDPRSREISGKPTIKNSLHSIFGRLDYTYNNRYYLTATLRRDGSSKLAPDNKWGTFPSFSLAWRPSNERFLEDLTWLDELKVRGSYGILGNVYPLSDFAYKTEIEASGDVAVIDGQLVRVLEYKRLGNKDLRWEENKQFNIGLDGEFFDRNLYFTFDYFIKKTEGMILDKELSGNTRFKSMFINGGDVTNKGFEFLLGYRKSYKDFSFNASLNASLIKNEVTYLDLAEDEKIFDKANIRGNIKNILATSQGQPLRSYYLVKTDGIFNSQAEVNAYVKDGKKIQPNAKPGDLKFVDANGDGKINDDDRQFMGSAFPDVSFGLNLSTQFRGFELLMQWQGVAGSKVFNGLKFTNYRVLEDNYNMVSDVKNAWTPSNTNTDIPRLSSEDKNGNFKTASDWYLEDASYVRLKNVTLGYNLPNKSFDAKVFLTGKNLVTFTKYKGFDPESSVNGIDFGYYPNAKSIILGVNLKF